jgi:hypothetical protein
MEHCTTGSTRPGERFNVTSDCVPIDVLKVFKDIPNDLLHCDTHYAEATCAPAFFIEKMLRFCYHNEYPSRCEFRDAEGKDAKSACRFHIYMYFLGKQFGIASLLPICVKEYAKDMSELNDETAFGHFVNVVYDLPGLDENDLLRAEARKQAETFAGNEFLMIQTKFLQQVKQSRVAQAMPKAAQELLLQSVDARKLDLSQLDHDEDSRAPSSEENAQEQRICVRCIEPVDNILDDSSAVLCGLCKEASWTSKSVYLPTRHKSGISMTFWECQGCSQLWSCGGSKRNSESLSTCRSCPDTTTRNGPHLHFWTCRACSSTWRTFGPKNQAQVALEKCICCPKEGVKERQS